MRSVLLVFIALTAAQGSSFTGPVSPYFLSMGVAGGGSEIVEVQGTSILNTFLVDHLVFAIADNTIYTRFQNAQIPTGSQYTLDGTPTGNTDLFQLPPNMTFETSYDGTSDGTYNYYADTSAVVDGTPSWNVNRSSLDWSNSVTLFSTPANSAWLGIAYDPANQSLWLGKAGLIADYSLDGTLLSSFATLVPGRALAYDPADGSLWTVNGGILSQYSTSGVLLQSGSIDGVGTTVYSGEILDPPVPEPGMLPLLACGAIIGIVQWRRMHQRPVKKTGTATW